MTTPTDPLQTAVAHHRAGRLREAAEIYEQILEAEPQNAEALHLMGMVAHEMGQHERAIRLVAAAVRIDGSRAFYHNNLGEVYRAAGKLAEAKASYLRAIEIDANIAQPYYNLALLHQTEGDAQAAAGRCRQAIAIRPDNLEALRLLAAALWALGDVAAAQTTYERVLAIDPRDFDTLVKLGTLLREANQFEWAGQYYQRALAIDPKSADLHVRLGDLEAAQGQWTAAIGYCETATRLDPISATAEMHLATVLQAAGDLEAAVAHYRRVLELVDDHKTARFNLATALESLGRPDEAAEQYETTLKLDPTYTDAHLNLGAYYQNRRNFERALSHYDGALATQPDSAKAHFNRALILLTEGKLEAGWQEFEWRLRLPGFPVAAFDLPRWDGSQIDDKTLLVHAEQGMGDTLQLVRYVPIAGQRCGRVVLLVQPPLVPLLKQAGFEVFSDERDLPQVDYHVPMMSLPAIVGTTLENIPADVPYLAADPELVDAWRERLGELEGFRVGICWQGSGTQLSDKLRSIPLVAFEPLSQVAGVRLVSLQKREGEQQLRDLAGRFAVYELGDDWDETAGAFMDTAAVMKNLDLVITVDTVHAHLAGALGVPVWVPLSTKADWRWLLERDDSPWYPTMRLFRQAKPGDWDKVFAELAAALGEVARGTGRC